MKLRQARFTDVLSHVDSRVELGETLTVLTGVSDSGKSGAMRGLLQVCRNEPAGIDLLRHAARRGSCSEVELAGVDDSDTPFSIVRRRGKSRNEYEVDGRKLLAFGQDVPVEVRGMLRLSPHAFQIQSDGNFMLSATDGEVARIMSSTVGLAEIDAAFTEIRRRKTANDTALRCAEADAEREAAAAAAYDGLPASAAAVEALEAAATALDSSAAEVDAMSTAAAALAGLRAAADVRAADAAVEAAVESSLKAAATAATVTEACSCVAALKNVPYNAWKPRLDAIAAVNAWKTLAGNAEAAQQLLWQAQNLAEEAETLVEDCENVVADAAAAVKAYFNAACRCDAETAELADELSASAGLESAAAVIDIEPSRTAVAAASTAAAAAAAAMSELNEMSRLKADLAGIGKMGAIFETEVCGAQTAISDYKRTHPVCPECGAKQQHWHIK